MSNRRTGLVGSALTEADVNLLKLVDSTQRKMRDKRFQYKQLNRISKLNEDQKTTKFINNFVKGDRTKDVKYEQRLLSKINLGFNQMLQETKDMYNIEDEEDVKRIRKIMIASENIKQTFENMAGLVAEQGQLIDRLDVNIEAGGLHIKNANLELNKLYESYNSMASSCQVCLAVTILVLSIILAFRIGG